MAGCLRRLADIAGKRIEECAPEDLTRIRHELELRYGSPNSRNLHLAALRGYARVADRMGIISGATMKELAALKGWKGTRLAAGRALSEEELAAMLAHCPREETIGARDGAMLCLLRAGLRRQEVVDLDVADVSLDGDGALRVVGKGDKERLVPLPVGARRLLMLWLAHRGMEPGPLLVQVGHTTRTVLHGCLCTQTIADRIEALWKLAGRSDISKPTAHDFRRTLATELLDKGADAHAVQDLLGHSLLQTTMRYDRGADKRKAKAMKLVEMPASTKPLDK